MYKKMFEGCYDGKVSYGTAEDKIGEEITDKIFGAIAPLFGTAADGLEGALGNATDYAQDALNGAANGAEQHFGNAYDSAGSFFDEQLMSLENMVSDAIDGINLGERVNGIAHSSWNYLNRGFDDMVKEIKKGF